MANPWDNDPVVSVGAKTGGNPTPWENDPVVDPDETAIDPSGGMGLYEQYRAGLGREMVRGYEGLKGLGLSALEHAGGTVEKAMPYLGKNPVSQYAREGLEKIYEQEAERRRIDAPLMKRPAARLGSLVGLGSQLIVPGVALKGTRAGRALMPSTFEGNTALGTLYGAAQPVVSENERLRNATVSGVVGGFASKFIPAVMKASTPAAKKAMNLAESFGINLKGAPGQQVEQVASAAQRGTIAEKGAALPAIQSAVKAERESARQAAKKLYEKAIETKANVAIPEVKAISTSARNQLVDQGFDLKSLPSVSKRLDELEQMAGVPFAREVKLKSMELWRKRINSMSPKDGSPEQAASKVLKKTYDEWLTKQFNDDMIIGDATAVKAWQDARASYSAYKETFDANKVIRDLAKKPDLTQEQMKSWILNANAVGAKKESGAIVRRLNQILGSDSKEMAGLRAEVLADIAEPMMRPVPDISAFIKNYDKYLANNPTLKRELFPNGLGEIEDVIKFARGIAKRPGATIAPTQQKGMWDAVMHGLTRYTFGHGIAQGGVRVRAAQGVVDALRNQTLGRSARKNILTEYLGADPKKPMFERGAGIPAFLLINQQKDAE